MCQEFEREGGWGVNFGDRLRARGKGGGERPQGVYLALFFFYFLTALFKNMRILTFKSQLTIAFFAAVNHLNGPLRKQNFTLTGSKGQGL